LGIGERENKNAECKKCKQREQIHDWLDSYIQ